jgi:hypothetical protein
MSLQEFRVRVKALDGRAFETDAQKQPFTLHVLDDGLAFDVGSSGKRRRERWEYVDQVLALYSVKPSFKPGDYQAVSRNASYVLRLLRAVMESA